MVNKKRLIIKHLKESRREFSFSPLCFQKRNAAKSADKENEKAHLCLQKGVRGFSFYRHKRKNHGAFFWFLFHGKELCSIGKDKAASTHVGAAKERKPRFHSSHFAKKLMFFCKERRGKPVIIAKGYQKVGV